ncbi:MAG: aldo/keto reductase [Prevotellaceae bacterium]|jgi:diketogulonate reductase-like aldo/keto reductase|nr:aldo/keto reductase [Prevotellaceae bacterium]
MQLFIKAISNETVFVQLINRVYRKLQRKIFHERRYIDAIAHSLRAGFTLVDFSAAYGNEQLMGKAIKRSGVERKDIFLTTRVSNKQQIKGNFVVDGTFSK